MIFRLTCALMAGAFLPICPAVPAQTNSYDKGANGKWHTAGNWSLGVRPDITQSGIFITNASTKTVTIDATTAGSFPASMTISNLTVSAPISFTNTLKLVDAGTNTALQVLNKLLIDRSGTLIVSNSSLHVDGTSLSELGIDGEANLQSGLVLATNLETQIVVGRSTGSRGTLTIADGTAVVQNLSTGGPGATGTVWITGGTLVPPGSLGDIRISTSLGGIAGPGDGRMIISNGVVGDVRRFNVEVGQTNSVRSSLTVAGGTHFFHNLSVRGGLGAGTEVWITGGQISNSMLNIFGSGSGNLSGIGRPEVTISNGFVTTGTFHMDDGSKLTIAGGAIEVVSRMVVGFFQFGSNSVFMTGGTLTVTNLPISLLSLGGSPTRPSTMIVSNGTVIVENLSVDTNSLLNVAGGMFTVLSPQSEAFQIGVSPGVTGVVSVTQSGEIIVTNGETVVGASGIGVFIVSNVTAQTGANGNAGGGPIIQGHGGGGGVLRRLTVGRDDGSEGSALFDGGSNIVYESVVLGNCPMAVGTLTVSNGGLHVTNSTGTAFIDVRSGTLTVSGGTLVADKLIMTNNCGVFVRTGGTVTIPNLDLHPSLDADRDGLPNNWEQQFGLDPIDSRGANGPNGDPDGDGLTNAQEFNLGTDPSDRGSPYRILSLTRQGNDIHLSWMTVGGKTNFVQVSAGSAGGSLSTNFVDISGQIIAPGTGLVITNFPDMGAATNVPSRYYRIRLAP